MIEKILKEIKNMSKTTEIINEKSIEITSKLIERFNHLMDEEKKKDSPSLPSLESLRTVTLARLSICTYLASKLDKHSLKEMIELTNELILSSVMESFGESRENRQKKEDSFDVFKDKIRENEESK